MGDAEGHACQETTGLTQQECDQHPFLLQAFGWLEQPTMFTFMTCALVTGARSSPWVSHPRPELPTQLQLLATWWSFRWVSGCVVTQGYFDTMGHPCSGISPVKLSDTL